MIQNLFLSLRHVLSVDTPNDVEERYLADAIDHADLERRIATQSRTGMAPLNIGR
jgi:hypothetical protein